MHKIIFFSIFTFFATAVFAQDEERKAEISELAKKYAEAIRNCPAIKFTEIIALDLRDKKITPEEFNQGIKMAGVEMMECTRQFHNELRSFSADEQEFFKLERQRHNAEFFANKKAREAKP